MNDSLDKATDAERSGITYDPAAWTGDVATWEDAGEVGVDAGHVMITDPCYWLSNGQTPEGQKVFPTWDRMAELLLRDFNTGRGNGITQLNYQRGHTGLGVVIGDFGGDVSGRVYVQRDERGMIVAAQIRWDGERPA